MDTSTLQTVIPEAVPKRRGRKPKDAKVEVLKQSVSIIDSLNVSSKQPTVELTHTVITDAKCETVVDANAVAEDTSVVASIDNGVNEPKKEKGRRGRKPKYVYSSYDITTPVDDSTCANNQPDDESVIVRLNISSDVLKTNDVVSGSNIEEQPYAYNHDTYNNISNIADILNCQEDAPNGQKSKNEGNAKVINVLNEFAEKNKNNEWPTNTSISCYWCVHRFENAPFGIPINYKNGTFEVFGCFCSLECATAHNFSENRSHDEMWERYQLINMMSRQMNLGNIVRCAPPRLSLKMFGGNMDIETFRNMGKNNKLMNVNFPPMTSITQQLEEINDFEISNDFKYIPVDDDRINKYKEKIVFKRSKPLIDKNKSLESTMNLKFASTA